MAHNPEEIRAKIMNFLKVRGPSLPIHVSKETGLSVLFSSAYLAELLGGKDIKISDMKVGGSPVYFLPGQEVLLENYTHFFKGKEKEAYLLLKEKKVLEDTKLDPAIRVALRQLKDFAHQIHASDNDKQLLFWRYLSMPEEEAKSIIQSIHQSRQPIAQPQQPPQQISAPNISPTPTPVTTQAPIPQAQPANLPTLIKAVEKSPQPPQQSSLQLLTPEPIKTKKEKIKEKSPFVESLLKTLIEENIELLEEKEVKKKEFYGVVRINSDLGKLRFLLICKDKKKLTDNDISLAVQHSHSSVLPILLAYSGEIDKKADKIAEQYSGIIQLKKLNL